MIIQTIKNNSSNFQLKASKEVYNVKNNLATNTDVFVRTQKFSKTSFAGSTGADRYGTAEDREAINYKIKLTPRKIDHIMKNANTTDEGLIAVHKEMAEEAKHVGKAICGFKVINNEFTYFSKYHMKDLINTYISTPSANSGKQNQANSALEKLFPGLNTSKPKNKGSLSHLASRVSGGKDRLNESLDALLFDFDEITEKYFRQGVEPIIDDYIGLNKYFKEGIEYVNMRKGDTPFREKLLDYSNKMDLKCNEACDNIINSLNAQREQLNKTSNRLSEQYCKLTGASVKRIVKSALSIARKFASYGG